MTAKLTQSVKDHCLSLCLRNQLAAMWKRAGSIHSRRSASLRSIVSRKSVAALWLWRASNRVMVSSATYSVVRKWRRFRINSC